MLKTTSASIIFAAISIGLLCCGKTSTAEPKNAPPTKEQIAQWIRDLGDNEFDTRQAASKRLWEAGKAAEPALQEAQKSNDPEVVRRSRELLDKFKWGIYPDTPAKIVQLIQQYQSAEEANTKVEAIQKLLDEGAVGCVVLAKIARAETNPEFRKLVLDRVTTESARALPRMLADGNYEALEELLELGMVHDPDSGIYNYAAFYLLRDRLDERIKHFKGKLDAKPPELVEPILANLLRIKGDFAEARKMAEKNDALLARILYQQGDWKELARRKLGAPGDDTAIDPETQQIHQAAFNRLAGNHEEATRILDELLKKALEQLKAGGDPNGAADHVAKALFLNDRPKDALELLSKAGQTDIAIGVLMAQLRPDAAFELLDNKAADKRSTPQEHLRIELQRARLLQQLGEKDKAIKIFKKLADEIKPEGDTNFYCEIVEAEQQTGQKELAREHAVKILGLLQNDIFEERLLQVFFPENGVTAHIWLNYLRNRFGEKDSAGHVAHLERIMQGRWAGEDVASWLDDLAAKTADRPEEERETPYLALAYATQAAGRKKDTQAYLEKACALKTAAPRSFVKLGDFFAAGESWEKAADIYLQGANRERTEPLSVYLHGWALMKAGRTDEGKKQIEMSHWIPLGNSSGRDEFARELAQRGFVEDARRERALVLRLDDTTSRHSAEALRRLMIDAIAKKDYLAAAGFSEASMVRVMNPSIHFVQPAAYVLIPEQIHRFRARGLLDGGKVDEALKEAEYCLSVHPGDIELPILLYSGLQKQGRKKEAAQIYDKSHAAMAKFCDQYPGSSFGHNSIAWLCALCRRDLEDGLKHAQKANDQTPDNAGYLDTLAELYFQTGNKAKAVELMRKCVELEPKRAYFRKQLKRLEKGDTSVEVPDELAEDE